MCRIARQLPKLLDQVRFLDGLLDRVALRVCWSARQSSKLPDEVRFLGGALNETNVLGVWRSLARDPAQVEDQVRLLAKTLDNLALEPDGTAAACKAASSGFDSHRRL